jgi:hypothetical protein
MQSFLPAGGLFFTSSILGGTMINRRRLVIGTTSISFLTVARPWLAYAQAAGLAVLAAAGKALLSAMVADLAKNLSERILPERFNEISSKLDRISAQVSIVINILLKLPEMMDQVVRKNFEDETTNTFVQTGRRFNSSRRTR